MVILGADPSLPLSEAMGIDHGQVIGLLANSGSGDIPVLWTSPSQHLSLQPNGYGLAAVRGIAGGQQVGAAQSNVDGNNHAVLWNGSAAGVVDLHPAGALNSSADATDVSQQVGTVLGNGRYTAALWQGTAATYVNLNPLTNATSAAAGVYGGIQVGSYASSVNSASHAVLWHGTAQSAVDLSPPFSVTSVATGISRGQIVGHANFDRNSVYSSHAILWNAPPDGSFNPQNAIDLTAGAPANITSQATAANGVQQVGYITTQMLPDGFPKGYEAAVWHGSASSVQLLPVPSGYGYSAATGIDADGNVSGTIATGPVLESGGEVAVMWVPHRLAGDANFDSTVGFDDLVTVARNYGQTNPEFGWVDGDFNDDGSVGFDDLLTVARNYQGAAPTARQLAQFDPTFQAEVLRAFADVPEPSGLALAFLGTAALPRMRAG